MSKKFIKAIVNDKRNRNLGTLQKQTAQMFGSLSKGNLDIWKRKEDGEGVSTVRSAYNKLQGTLEEGVNEVFETLWKTRVTPKAQLLGWRMLLDKLPTKAKLIAKGILLQLSLCEFCLECEETVEHLFFSCKVAQKVWNMCYKWLGLNIVSHVKATINFQHFFLLNLNKRQNIVWHGMWLAIIGEIWKHMNRVIFKQSKVDPTEIFALAQVMAWVWMKHKIPSVKFSYSDWCLSPYTCLKTL